MDERNPVSPIVLKTDTAIPLAERQRATLEAIGARLIEQPCETESKLARYGREADALLVVDEPVSARVIGELRRCRVIARFGVGLDTIDVDAATAAGIQVTNVPAASVEEVSDHALAMLLALGRSLTALDATVRRGSWDPLAGGQTMRRLRGLVVGVIGLGRIGSTFARKASVLGFTVLAYDPYQPPAAGAAASAIPVEMPELLARADFVSIHAPLTPDTRGLIGAPELALMKPSAYLINVARGAIVDQPALVEALATRRIAGAALDVLAQEPPDEHDLLLSFPNVLLTPHAAHYSEESLEEVRQTAVEEVARVLAGETPLHPVNHVAGAAR